MVLLLLLTWLQVRCRTLRTLLPREGLMCTEDVCGLLASRGWTACARGGGDRRGLSCSEK